MEHLRLVVLIYTQSFLILSRTNGAADITKFSVLASSMPQILMKLFGQDGTSLSQLPYLNRPRRLRMLASDSRDRVFGFLGFADDVAELGIKLGLFKELCGSPCQCRTSFPHGRRSRSVELVQIPQNIGAPLLSLGLVRNSSNSI